MKTTADTTRRQFITRVFGTTALLGLATSCRRFEIAPSAALDPDVIKKFGGTLKGRIILPADPAYDSARRVISWNPRTERRPVIVARCAHVDDVTRSIEFARRHGLETAVRAGGHSFLGWGTCNGMIIDLSGMRQVTIDPTKRVGRVDAGVLSGDFVWEAGRHGLAPVLGQCPSVGVAGVTLGGGLGWLSGQFGAACDNLVSARIATADGRLLLADASSNQDLFWAVRGGSGNFGVATSLEFRLYPVGVVIAGQIKYRLQDARAVLRVFRDLMATAPDWFQADVTLSAGDRSVVVDLCYQGHSTEGEQLLRQLRSAATASEDSVKSQNYAELCGTPHRTDREETIPRGFSSTQGVYLKRLSEDVIDIILDRMVQAPAGAAIGFSHYMHGEVCRTKPDATAFELRESGAGHMWIDAIHEQPAAADRLLAWADETWQRLKPFAGGRIYANYQSDEGKGAAQAVFGGNHSRLMILKNKYDPANFFRRNSNVRPAI